jgi:phage terminase large subunit
MTSKPKLELTIPHNYISRDYQDAFWRAMSPSGGAKKRAFMVWHRRAGKEKTCWNYLISQAVRRKGTYWYILPDSKMARRVLWDGMDYTGFKFIDHVPKPLVKGINNTEMKIKLFNGSDIVLLGSHDEDSLRGANPVGCVFSEYAEHSEKAWQTVAPIFRENEGWVIFNCTPKGTNHAYDLYNTATSMPDTWFAQTLSVRDTKLFTDEQIDQFCKEDNLSEDMKQQEYYCSWHRGIDGSYYAKYLQTAKDEGRVGNVPYDRQSLVHTAWDLGYGDSTAIVFYQVCGQEIHIIDCYENHGEGLAHYVKVLADRKYIYGKHYAPHDVESHSMATGLSAKRVASDLGIAFVTLPTLRTRVEDGIESVRGIFSRIWIDAVKCKPLLKALDHYHKEFDVAHNCYRLKPVHDWSSNFADSLRYLGIATKLYVDESKSGIDDKQSEKWFKQFNPLFT